MSNVVIGKYGCRWSDGTGNAPNGDFCGECNPAYETHCSILINREKEIEEMAKVIDELLVDKPIEVTHHALNEATYLFDNDYRKVYKTAQEIIERLATKVFQMLPTKIFILDSMSIDDAIKCGEERALRKVLCLIAELKKKYEEKR